MSAVAHSPDTVRFEPLTLARLDLLLDVERQAYAYPWTRGNFTDALAAGYETQLLIAANDDLIGYFVAMQGVDEVHLLNLTVAPSHQRQGWAHLLLDALALWARSRQAQWLWLEVRVSNQRARDVYLARGFRTVGERKRYYPAANGSREDAIVMSLAL
ncbi:ribosomal protein S18-alanine N-acetyltransferase [Paracidovorax anthurii]|uniref:[Ribosomal protein bS18]-alanine N-acetyltransferase n=1 Tax=Paracidovorax anthurii TaxID=78229 RepID=A0A328Z5A0_9BURK|nr:ribosomal protein S18-alanine N-acetyltransferase [Paracidovorax anthurii]RAR77406.1 [SSU ribosomal protein S18P]-alanine acetyltransferase [Paracidovorax anthurii]WCM92924.1 ribosomal protein S18-alanine N-acetyltransferase [Acidovorax sp. NCPPB 2350]